MINRSTSKGKKASSRRDVAIVGIACRFPQANNYDEFWGNLVNGKNSITSIEEWRSQLLITNKLGRIENVNEFDNQFFNISPREAMHMEPQQRLLLQETWRCIEDSGVSLAELQKSNTSVFVGAMSMDQYFGDPKEEEIDVFTGAGNYFFMLANRISYVLNLTGESQVADYGCASGLASIIEGCRSIQRGDSEYAIVAGTNIHYSELKYWIWSKNRMLSPRGQCNTFDKDADGFVAGEGIGVILLQPLEKAIQDKSNIYGVIKGCCINHCGHGNAVSAPKMEAQRDAILRCYKEGDIDARTISYVETHGTGTSLGDPIEVEALTQAFSEFTEDKRFCEIGSVKTNIGHLIGGSGMASMIKVLLMMRYKKIPPSLNFKVLNPIIELQDTCFKVQDKLADWIKEDPNMPYRAGINSIGYGGVNTHVILEEYMPKEKVSAKNTNKSERAQIFTLSAKTSKSLEEMINNWKQQIDTLKEYNLKDICNTLLLGREQFRYRYSCVVENLEQLKENLNHYTIYDSKKEDQYLFSIGNCKLALKDYSKMFKTYPILNKSLVDLIEEADKLKIISDLKQKFFENHWNEDYVSGFEFIISFAIQRTAQSLLDEKQVYMISGNGNGIWVALALSGILKWEDILRHLLNKLPMKKLICKRPQIPFYDSIDNKVISPYKVKEDFIEEILKSINIEDESVAYYLNRSGILYGNQYTFRKYMNEWNNVLKEYELEVEQLIDVEEYYKWNITRETRKKIVVLIMCVMSIKRVKQKWNLPEKEKINNKEFYILLDLVMSGVISKQEILQILLGDIKTLQEVQGQIVSRVNTCDVNEFEKRENVVGSEETLDEITNLKSWISSRMKQSENIEIDKFNIVNISFEQNACDIVDQFEQQINKLWQQGINFDWKMLHADETYHKLHLPVYEFEKNTFNVPYSRGHESNIIQYQKCTENDGGENVMIHKIDNRYLLSKNWKKEIATDKENIDGTVAIIVSKEVEALAGDVTQHIKDYVILRNDRLKEDFNKSDVYWKKFRGVIDLVGCGKDESYDFNWIKWIQLLLTFGNRTQLKLLCVTKGLENFMNSSLTMYGAKRVGLYRMLQSEYKSLQTRHIDVSPSLTDKQISNQIIAEFKYKSTTPEVAYRANERYCSYLGEIDNLRKANKISFDKDQVLVITGGTRGIGALCAKHLVDNYGVRKLVLIGREVLPPRSEWNNQQTKGMTEKINNVKYLEDKGAKVEVLSINFNDQDNVKEKIKYITENMGPIGGIIHGAGVADLNNPVFIKKATEDINAVLLPKIKGLDYLINSIKGQNLKFFIVFSSVSSIIPVLGVGQGDYALANDYMNYCVQYHKSQLPMIAIMWPSWKEIGMGEVTSKAYLESGLTSITNKQGLAMLDEVLGYKNEDITTVLPAIVEKDKFDIRQLMLKERIKEEDMKLAEAANNTIVASKSLKDTLSSVLVDVFEKELRCSIDDLDKNFQGYGVDSIFIAELITSIESKIKGIKLDALAFLEYPSINQLTGYILDEYASEVQENLDGDSTTEESIKAESGSSIEEKLVTIFSEELLIDKEKIDVNTTMQELGIDSIFIATLTKKIEEVFKGISLDPTCIIEYNTISRLAGYIQEEFGETELKDASEEAAIEQNNTNQNIEETLVQVFKEELSLNTETIDSDVSFQELGVDSIFMVDIIKHIERVIPGVKIDATDILEFNTIGKLAKYINETVTPIQSVKSAKASQKQTSTEGIKKEVKEEVVIPTSKNRKIAVIGMACHFPGAQNIEEYWDNLCHERDSVEEIPIERWDWRDEYYRMDGKDFRATNNRGGFIKDIDKFDPEYFRVSDKQAIQMDPLQRQWLEVSVEALADAGYTKEDVWGKLVGVFVGARVGYFYDRLEEINSETINGYGQNFISVHLSHFLNLKGPNMVIDAACASSLTAINLAINSITSGESEMAFAGGVEILEPSTYKVLSPSKILCPDGKCKTFSNKANGIVIGEGCGVILLKALDKAIADGDKIYGVIDGGALNNDGNTMGIKTPDPKAQEDLVLQAIKNADIDGGTISYFEAHGTGTMIGDPIELKSLSRVLRRYSNENNYCGIGSVKCNIGHLLCASAVASVIKVLLCITKKQLPASINCEPLTTRFKFESSPLYVVRSLENWKPQGDVLRAGISAFGLGGSNAHLIVSNEGIPERLKAELTPKGETVQFNRRVLWSNNHAIKHPLVKNNSLKVEQHAHKVDILKSIQEWLKNTVSEELHIKDIDLNKNLQIYGVDSIFLAEIIKKMDKELKIDTMDPIVFLEHSTLDGLSKYMVETYNKQLLEAFGNSSQEEQEGLQGDKVRETIIQNLSDTNIDFNKSLSEMGINSKQDLINSIMDKLIETEGKAVSDKAVSKESNTAVKAVSNTKKDRKVAVIGMACHFPDAANIKEYWENLINGIDSMREIPKDRWDCEGDYYISKGEKKKCITNLGAFMKNDIYEFDPAYFKISDIMAEQMDPLQKQMLEVGVEALSDAGYTKENVWGKNVGIFVGARAECFLSKVHEYNAETPVGIGENFISMQLAHFLNLKGPNMVIEAACASSLTALHLAAKSIQQGESDMAFVGGVEILERRGYHILSGGKILSPDGRCKTFADNADGIGVGEGCGVVLLKPLDDAIKDNDKIYGVIDGSALNSDGNTMGITTPNPQAQEALIEKAIADADIKASSISYVEAHGTGTMIGDPIELRALTRVLSKETDKKQYCGVGSVKSNIGHLLCASGVASVIKVLLSITNQELPPTINCEKVNPRFAFEESPLYLVQKPTKWQGDHNLRRAGISSFGLGGNNAHVIISDEGIPSANRATLDPKGGEIKFNRKKCYYHAIDKDSESMWETAKASNQNSSQDKSQDDDDDFLDFFIVRN